MSIQICLHKIGARLLGKLTICIVAIPVRILSWEQMATQFHLQKGYKRREEVKKNMWENRKVKRKKLKEKKYIGIYLTYLAKNGWSSYR